MKCHICGSREIVRAKFDLGNYRIAQCECCEVFFNETYFSDPAFKDNLFEKDYYEKIQSEAFKNRFERMDQDPSVKIYRRYLNWIKKQQVVSKALDVGCAFGTFLRVLSEEGIRPFGVEKSAYSSGKAREQWGFDIFNGELKDCPFPEEEFDLVTFWDVLEHVPDPVECLVKAHRLLKKGGKILLTTDNASGLIARMGAVCYHATLGKFTYPMRKFFIPYNTFYFNPVNLKNTLHAHGFKPVLTELIDYPIEKLNLSFAEKIIIGGLYGAGSLLKLNSQFIMIAEKI